MSIEQQFEKEFGSYFVIEDKENYKDVVVLFDASAHCGLFYADKFDKNLEWKGFALTTTNFGCDYLLKGEWGFSTRYIEKAVRILNPNEHAFYFDYNVEEKRDDLILALKNNKYIILIAPRRSDIEEDYVFTFKKFKDFMKEIPKSVFVL